MSASLQCYRCGASLDALSLPIARQDQCPDCFVYVHCCRMCEYFDPDVAEQCREDDAEEVKNKEGANFCDYFRPTADAHDPQYAGAEAKAHTQLDALFGGDSGGADATSERGHDDGDDDGDDHGDDASGTAAEDLFR